MHISVKVKIRGRGKDGVNDDSFISELFPNLGSPGDPGGEKNDMLVESLENFSSGKIKFMFRDG